MKIRRSLLVFGTFAGGLLLATLSCKKEESSNARPEAGAAERAQAKIPADTPNKKGESAPRRLPVKDPVLEKLGADAEFAALLSHVKTLSVEQIEDQLQLIKESGKRDEQSINTFSILIDELSRRDPAATIAKIEEGFPFAAEGLRERLFEQMLKTFPPEVLTPLLQDYLSRGGTGKPNAGALALLQSIANFGDAASSAPLLKEIFSRQDAGRAISTYFETLGAKDSKGALLALESLQLPEKQKNDAKLGIAFGGMSRDPAASLELLKSLKTELVGPTYSRLFASWLAQDGAAATSALASLDGPQMQAVLRDSGFVHLACEKGDLNLLQTFLDRVPVVDSTFPQLSRLLTTIGKKDPEKAMAYVNAMEASELRSNLVVELYKGGDYKTVDEVQSAISNVPADLLGEATRGATLKLLEQGVEVPASFIDNAPESVRSMMATDLVLNSFSKDQSAGQALLAAQFNNGNLSVEDAREVAKRLAGEAATNNADTSLAWASSLPEEIRPFAVEGAVASWVKADPIKAADWLAGQADSPWRNAGIRSLVNEVKRSNPKLAKQWEDEIAQSGFK